MRDKRTPKDVCGEATPDRQESWEESKKEVTNMPPESVRLSALRLCGDG